ncbi:MAG: hypothetical protein ACSNEK_09080 [Parachlamydiaceae bacterium]
MEISPTRKAFERVFSVEFNRYSKWHSCLQLTSTIPLIGGIARLALWVYYYHANKGNQFYKFTSAKHILDYQNRNHRHAKKVLEISKQVNRLFLASVFIAFTPLSFCLAPLQLIATLTHAHRCRVPYAKI